MKKKNKNKTAQTNKRSETNTKIVQRKTFNRIKHAEEMNE